MLLEYWSRLQACGYENPAKTVIQECWEYGTYQSNGFGWITKAKSEEYRVSNIRVTSTPLVLSCNTDRFKFNRNEDGEWEEGEIAYKASNYIRNNHYSYLDIYTDGFKDENDEVGTGVYIPSLHIIIGKRLPDQMSNVYSPEMMAIIIGLQWVEEVRSDRVVLCVHSLATLQSIHNWNSNRQDLLLETQQSLYRLHRAGITITFCGVPAHVGIKGNDGADKTAKIATKMNSIIHSYFGENLLFGKAKCKK